MKTKHILWLSFAALALSSCYEDLSTEAAFKIPEINIFSENDILNVAYGHELVVDPVVEQEGRSEDDFEYLWEMDLTLGSKDNRIELGTEKHLVYKVSNSPSDKPYTLTLTVTDKQTGLAKMASWEVYVSSSLGEGILVAVTGDGGRTSDLTLLASKPVTYGYASDSPLITEELYSFANGHPIEGRVNALVSSVVTDGATFNTTRVMVGTDEHLIAIDPISYKETERDASLFNGQQTEFNTSMLFNFGDYATAAIIAGRFYCCIGNIDRAYSRVPVSSKREDIFYGYNMAFEKPDQGKVLVYNPEDLHFHWASILSVMGGMSSIEEPGIYYSLEGAVPVAGGCMKDSYLSILLKLTDGTYHLVSFELSVINPVARDIVLTGMDDVENALGFAFCDNANVFYYYTESKIHTVIVSGSTCSVKTLSWKPDGAGEKITAVTQYEQAWYGTSQNSFNAYPFVLDYHRTQILVTTYDKELNQSKVYIRPFSTSTGLFLMKDNGSFTVPGQITALTTTPR